MTQRSRFGKAPMLLAILAATWLGGCGTETEEPDFNNPFDPDAGADLPVPESVTVAVGDQRIRLSWELPQGESADEYAVFRRRTGGEEEESERLLERVTAAEYTDAAVRNGRVYAYRIAAGVSGRFGARSEEVEARPGLFSILLANDDEVTRERGIVVSYTVPDAEAVRCSEDASDFSAPWQPAVGQTSWTLSPGDGTKTLYARFRLFDGSESLPVFDSIRLDTRAAIESFAFDGPAVRAPGETIHFRMVTGEPHGTARVTVDGVFSGVPLFDDGSNGDATANDGTYERDLPLPAAAAVQNEMARGTFVDQAGNSATEAGAPLLLTVRKSPDPVTLFAPEVAEPPDDPAATLRWTYSSEAEFFAYRIYRAASAPVDSTDELVGNLRQATTLEYDDMSVVEGRTYHYRVYVQDTFGRERGSNSVSAVIANERPPQAITLRTPSAMSTDRIALEWFESEDLDFQAYRIHRNETGAVSDGDPLLVEIDDVTRTSHDDAGLRENTTYYYRIYVVDQGGLRTRSNEVEARTRNEAPPGVTLHEAAAIDTSSATLSWAASTAHDFAYYRLYRDTISTVTTGSTRVVELDDEAFTSFRDTGLDSETRYYYRVFVVDDGDEAQATGSNTITLETH